MVSSMTLKIEGWGLLYIQHVWMEDGNIGHPSWWNVKPFFDESFCKHVQRVKMRFVKTELVDEELAIMITMTTAGCDGFD